MKKKKSCLCKFFRGKDKMYERLSEAMNLWKNQDYVIFHVGTNELNSELPPERIAKPIIDVAKTTESDSRIVSISDTVPRNDNFNIKAMKVNKELSRMCEQEKLIFLSHSNINPKTQ